MKIKFLGTAAAEAFPALFCDCDNCKRARELGGKNYRTRSQTIIDEDLIIDFPCDTLYHVCQHNIDLLKVKYVLITHTHADHFYPKDFSWLMGSGYSHPPKDWYGITVYGNDYVGQGLQEIVALSEEKVNFCKLELFVETSIGEYKVTALNAVHSAPDSYIYIIEKKGIKFLYAHDSDIFPEDTWNFIKNNNIKFDIVSLDCTEGAYEKLDYNGHMCLGINRKCRDMLFEIGAADNNTKFILNHFSHNGLNSSYTDFCELAEPDGFIVSYDGKEICL